ncbi:MAG: response regulator transcription factor [Acidimicrobiales bacterium]
MPDSSNSPQTPIRVVLVDDHVMLRESVARLLAEQGGIDVVAVGGTAREALELTDKLRPDVLVIDHFLPDGTGIDVVHQLKSTNSDVRAVLISGSGISQELAAAAIYAGCSAVVDKTRAVSELAEAVRSAANDEVLIHRSQLMGLSRGTNSFNKALTPREQEILDLLAQGRASKDIASLLGLSLDSVRNHIQHLLVTFEAHSQIELVAKARHRGVL